MMSSRRSERDRAPCPRSTGIPTTSRSTAALRIIWAIPALVIMYLLHIVNQVLAVISWFTIVITGKQPRGLFDFMLKAQRYASQTLTYVSLQTDTYPAFS